MNAPPSYRGVKYAVHRSPDSGAVSFITPTPGYKKYLEMLPADEAHFQMLEWLENMPYTSSSWRSHMMSFPNTYIRDYFTHPQQQFNPSRPGRRMEYK